MTFLKKHAYGLIAVAAFVLSACNTFTDLRPIPDIYKGAQSPAETALITLKAFGAAQETVEVICSPVQPGDPLLDPCIVLLTAEQTLRPAVTAAGLVGVEYADIDARIRQAGPDSPGEWLAISGEVAARLISAYEPIRADVESFIQKAGALTNG